MEETDKIEISLDHLPVVFAGHNNYLLSVARLCQETEQFTDVTIFCSDGTLKAHKLMLASASEFLKKILVETGEEPATLIIPEVSEASFKHILEFIYTGRMLLSLPLCNDLQRVTETLGINPANVRVDDVVKNNQPVTKISMTSNPVFENAKTAIDSKTDSVDTNVVINGIQGTKKSIKRRNSSDNKRLPTQKTAKKSRLSLPDNLSGHTKTKRSSKSRRKSSNSSSVPSGYHDISRKETWVCAICEFYDPPEDMRQTTEWIGCDCNRWYHQHCTKLKKIKDDFSCKDVGLKCLPTES